MIDSFQGEYRFLSNFFIEPDHTHVEGEYQAAKSTDAIEQAKIRLMTPSAAKRCGQKVKLISGWNDMKMMVMTELVAAKFRDHRDLRDRLLATRDQELVEGNYWNDTYWGVCKGVGENRLGRILMCVREVIK